MIQSIDLRSLADLHGNGRDFLSIYCNSRDNFEGLKNRLHELEQLVEDQEDEAEHFDMTLGLIRETLDKCEINGSGFAAFGCGLLDFVQVYKLNLPVTEGAYLAPAPYILPLAMLRDEYQTFAVVACSNDGASIHLVTEEKAAEEERVRGGVKNHVKKGGWSQKRYARRRENQLSRYAAEVAEALTEIVKSHQIERIVLTGSEETMNEIEYELPPDIAEKIIGKEAFDLHRGTDEVIDAAYEVYFASERKEEQNLWEEIRNEVMRHGLGVAGPTRVLEALQQGRVDTLLMTMNTHIPGMQCRDCETVVHGTPETCQSCGSRSVFEVELAEVLTQWAERTSAWVEFSEEIPGLSKAKHVAALLRY